MATKKASSKKGGGSKRATSRTGGSKKAVSKKGGSKKGGSKKSSSKRELIDTGRDKRFVRRDEGGRFDESDDVGRSLSQDRKRAAKTEVQSGQGDKGDRKRGK